MKLQKFIAFALALLAPLAAAHATTLADLLGGESITYDGLTFSNFHLTYSGSNTYTQDVGAAPVTFSMQGEMPSIEFGITFTTAGTNTFFEAVWGYTVTPTDPNSVITDFINHGLGVEYKTKNLTTIFTTLATWTLTSSDGKIIGSDLWWYSPGTIAPQSSMGCNLEILITTGTQRAGCSTWQYPNPEQSFYLTTVPEPSTWAMLVVGGMGMLTFGHRLRRRR